MAIASLCSDHQSSKTQLTSDPARQPSSIAAAPADLGACAAPGTALLIPHQIGEKVTTPSAGSRQLSQLGGQSLYTLLCVKHRPATRCGSWRAGLGSCTRALHPSERLAPGWAHGASTPLRSGFPPCVTTTTGGLQGCFWFLWFLAFASASGKPVISS